MVLGHLEDGEQRLGEGVEGAALGLRLVEAEAAAEELHPQQGEDDDEEEEQQQQRGDGLHRVQQRAHQVAQRRPVPGGNWAYWENWGGLLWVSLLVVSPAGCHPVVSLSPSRPRATK